MSKREKSALDEDSALNSVGARLALYTALAGAIGAGTAIAIKRHNMREAAYDVDGSTDAGGSAKPRN
jgi:hypothetical protein